MNPNDVMCRYLAERESRGSVGAISLTSISWVSKCCATATSPRRKGGLTCLKCGQPCDEAEFHAPKAGGVGSAGDWDEIHVKATRNSARGIEDAIRARAAQRWIILERLVESRPRSYTKPRWRFDLCAWEVFLHPTVRRNRRIAAETGAKYASEAGSWTEWSVRCAVEEAQDKVAERLSDTSRTHIRAISFER